MHAVEYSHLSWGQPCCRASNTLPDLPTAPPQGSSSPKTAVVAGNHSCRSTSGMPTMRLLWVAYELLFVFRVNCHGAARIAFVRTLLRWHLLLQSVRKNCEPFTSLQLSWPKINATVSARAQSSEVQEVQSMGASRRQAQADTLWITRPHALP